MWYLEVAGGIAIPLILLALTALLYLWFIQFVFCFLFPILVRNLFSSYVKEFSIGRFSIFPLEVRLLNFVLKAPVDRRLQPEICVSFNRLAVDFKLRGLLYPIYDLLQVLPSDYYANWENYECMLYFMYVSTDISSLTLTMQPRTALQYHRVERDHAY